MAWVEKVGGMENFFLFCAVWRSKKDISDKFDLTNTEAWNACKYLKTMPYYIQIEREQGRTKRMYIFKTRHFEVKRIMNKNSKLKNN